MLCDTVTPDGYTVDENGAWKLGFVRRKYVLDANQTEMFKDAAEGLLSRYENQFQVPSGIFIQPRAVMTDEDRTQLLNALLAVNRILTEALYI